MRLGTACRRIVALIVTAVLLMPAMLCFSGCNMFNVIRDNFIDTTPATISEQELVRLIIMAVSNKNDISSSYSQIPEEQRDDISYSVFNEYVAILSSVSEKYGTIQSFKVLNDHDSNDYFKAILSQTDCTDFPSEYGHLSVIELDYGDTLKAGREDSRCRFCVSLDDNGTAYLSRKYVTDMISAYNYLGHYFTMLENNNTDGLFALLDPLYNDDIYINSVISAKVQYIAEFYLLKVRSTRSEYVYDEISPLLVTVTIPKVIGDDGESITEHKVKLSVNPDGSYDIDDQIPWYLDTTSLGVYDATGNAVRITGVALNVERMRALLGDPYYYNVYELSDEDKIKFGKPVGVRAVYSGIVVSIYADDLDDGWEGLVHGIRIYSDQYSIDGQITVGMNISELLLIYPMLDEADYSFNFESGRDEYTISFNFDNNNNISDISIAKAFSSSK